MRVGARRVGNGEIVAPGQLSRDAGGGKQLGWGRVPPAAHNLGVGGSSQPCCPAPTIGMACRPVTARPGLPSGHPRLALGLQPGNSPPMPSLGSRHHRQLQTAPAPALAPGTALVRSQEQHPRHKKARRHLGAHQRGRRGRRPPGAVPAAGPSSLGVRGAGASGSWVGRKGRAAETVWPAEKGSLSPARWRRRRQPCCGMLAAGICANAFEPSPSDVTEGGAALHARPEGGACWPGAGALGRRAGKD